MQLRITLDKNDLKPDIHCVAYDGKTVRDNADGSTIKCVERKDRASKEAARALFDSFYPWVWVRLGMVFEIVEIVKT